MDTLIQDIRYGLRTLTRNYTFTLVAVVTLALGIGANSAIFSVLNGVVLSPLPYDQPESLVTVWGNIGHPISVSNPNFRDWSRSARSFQEMAALTNEQFDLTGPGTPEHLDGRNISSGFFSTLGVKLTLGREFSADEDGQGGVRVALISERLWRERFSGSPQALGRAVTLDGVDYSIVGVVASQLQIGREEADVYTPLGQADPVWVNDRAIHSLMVVGRLKPGMTVAQAQDEMNAIQKNIDHLYPALDRGMSATIIPLKQVLVGDVSATLTLLMGAVGLVLLIACANVANLLLARSRARAREFAIRSALGASRGRIVRQLLTESVLLSLAGGCLGLLAAKSMLRLVLAFVPGSLPRSENIGLHPAVLFFTFALSVLVGALFGLAPALNSGNADVEAALKEGGRGSSSMRNPAQRSLVVVQTGLTVVLLAGAGLLFQTIRHLWLVNPGFDFQNVITFKVGLPSLAKTPEGTRTSFQQLVERIRQIPGVQAAELTALVPLSQQDNSGPFWVGTQPPPSLAEMPRTLFYWVGPDYARTMKIPLLRGRFFSPEDAINPPVIVIDSVLARDYFQDTDPVGQNILIPHWGTARVIGVVDHVRHWELGDSGKYVRNQIYASLYQLPDRYVSIFYRDMAVTVRTSLSASTLIPSVKSAAYGEGNKQPIYAVASMRDLVSDSMSSQRLAMILLGAFAVLALVLACVGIYGVISYSVIQRVRELGVRMALGAQKSDVLRMIISDGLGMTLLGLAIGAIAALVLGRVLSIFSRLLYGVHAADPVTFVAIAVLLIAVAIMACYIPARRATRVEPVVALRHE